MEQYRAIVIVIVENDEIINNTVSGVVLSHFNITDE